MVDRVSPSLLSAAPQNGATSIPANANLVLTFSEAVNPGTGYISIIGGFGGYGSNSKYIDISDTSQVTFEGSVITINPLFDFSMDQSYRVEIPGDVITDLSGNSFSGISYATPLYFYTGSTVDYSAPQLLGLNPADNSYQLPVNANLVLTFDEPVIAGSGTILINTGEGYYGASTKIIDVTDSSQVSFAGNVITINPTFNFSTYTYHSVTFGPGTIKDLSGNAFEGISDNWYFDFGTGGEEDITAPTLFGFAPSDNTWSVPVNANLVFTFSEDVAPGSGTIWIDGGGSGSTSKIIDVSDSTQVTFLGKTVTINPSSDLAKNTAYNVTFQDGVIQDVAGNPFVGIDNTTQFNFVTSSIIDNVAPALTGSSPNNNTKLVPLNANLVLTFNEAVAPGTGFISISGGYGGYGSNSKYIDVNDTTQVTFSGKTVTINPSSDFSVDQSYSVEFFSGVINDLAGNAFLGLPAFTPLSFVTGASGDYQTPTLLSATPSDNANAVPVNANIVMSFSEAVAPGTGYFYIVAGGGGSGSQSKYIDVTDSSQVTFSGNTVTINPYTNLAANSSYSVTFSNSLIKDLSGNPFSGLLDPTALNFSTAAIADVGSPTLISSFPSDDMVSVPINAQITLVMSEDVSPGSGYILIDGGSGSMSKAIDVNDSSQVTFLGNKVTINPSTDLWKNWSYKIQISNGVINDWSGNSFSGLYHHTQFNFVTASDIDRLAPTISLLSPLDGALDAAVDDNISLIFSETIQYGKGHIELRSGSVNGELIESFNIENSALISLSHNSLTINPSHDLVNGTQYFLILPSGIVQDIAGNSFSGSSSYDFTIAPFVSSPIYGTKNADNLTGTKGNDIIAGLNGNDTISGGAGHDEINGGEGTDTANYISQAKQFDIRYSSGLYFVKDKDGNDGEDILSNIEFIAFNDRLIDLSFFSQTASLEQDQVSSLVELYIASFNRAPDAMGLNYWGSQLASGAMSLNQIAKSFFVQPETIALYSSSPSTAFFVSKVYNNVLSRSPDQDGLNYWVEAIEGGRISKDMFLLAIINGAKAPSGSLNDKMTLQNKIEVGMDYAFIEGLSNSVWASNVMSSVNSTSHSVAEAKLKTDFYASSALKPETYELTVKLVGIWDMN